MMLAKTELVSSINCVQSVFLVVCKCMSVLLYPVVMSYVDCGDDW